MAAALVVPGVGRVTLTDLHRELARRDALYFDWWTSDFKRSRPKHLQFISEKICRQLDRGGARIIVCAPPGHGKSELISRAVSAWFIWKYPERRIGLLGYSDAFADSWGRKVRDLLVEHSELGVALDQGKDAAVGEWRTKKGGGMICAGIMGGIMGRRLHLATVDDPVKNAADAYSPTYQYNMRQTYQSTIGSRLEPNASVIVTMQRWPSSDFVTWLIEQKESGREDWELILLPAIAEADDPIGRQMGEPLWPERYDLNALEAKRLSLEDPAFWRSQWQQSPPEASTEGLAYHAFSAQHSFVPCDYDPKLPLCLACDFNVDPMAWLIAQVQRDFSPQWYDTMGLVTHEETSNKTIRILDEIFLANTTTQAATYEFIERAERLVPRGQKIEVIVYGDASGHSRKTSGLMDYRVIQERLERAGRFVVSVRATHKDPPVRDRVTTVNNAFLNARGERRLLVDPRCKELKKDFMQMRWKRDVAGNPTGELDKSNTQRSHISDALGYLCWGELKMQGKAGWQ
jgi:hypothetical protein